MNRLIISIAALVMLGGCVSETIYLKDGQAVQLRETVKGVKVWVITEDGEKAPSKVDLAEGIYCLPDSPGE